VPLHREAQLVGGLHLVRNVDVPWSSAELALVAAVGEHAWDAHERARRVADEQPTAQQWADVLDRIGDGLVAFDRDWRCTCVNGTAAALLGLEPARVLGRPARDVLPDFDDATRQYAWAPLRRVMATRTAEGFDSYAPTWDRWFEPRAAPAPDGGVLLGVRDITPRKREALALAASERRLAHVLAHVPSGVLEVDATGTIIYANAAAARIADRPTDQIIGLRYDAPDWSLTTPDGRPIAPGDLPAARALRGEAVLGAQHAVGRPGTSEPAIIAVTAVPIREREGAPVTGALATFEDVTPRARDAARVAASERLLRTVTDNATLALFIVDARQRCVYLNPAAERLTGYTLTELQERVLHDVVHHTRPDGRPYPLAECPIGRASPSNGRERGTEMFIHRDGSFYPVAYTASPLRDERTGAAVGTILEVRDLREERSAVAERERLLAAERVARGRVERLQAVTAALAPALTGADVARHFAAVMRDAVGARGTWVCRMSADGSALETLGASGYDAWVVATWPRIRLDAGEFPVVHVARDATPRWFASRAALKAAFPAIQSVPGEGEGSSDEALVLLPLVAGGRTLGTVAVSWTTVRDASADELAFLGALAAQCAQALARAEAHEAERQARRRTELVQAVTASLAAAATTAAVTTTVARAMREATGATTATLVVVDGDAPESPELQFQASAQAPPTWVIGRAAARDWPAPLAMAVREGRIVSVPSAEAWTGTYGESQAVAQRAKGVEGFVAVPCRMGERVLAAVALGFAGPRTLASEEHALLEAIGAQCAQALERVDLFEREKADRRRTERLQSITAALADTRRVADVTHALATAGLRATGALSGAVLLRQGVVRGAEPQASANADDDGLVIVASTGIPPELVTPYERLPLAATPATPSALVARTGAPLFAERHDGPDGLYSRFPDMAADYARLGAAALASVPLTVDGAVIGVITLTFASAQRFDEATRTFYVALAEQASQALERARLFEAEHAARERAEAEARRTATLQALAGALADATDVAAIAELALTAGREVTGIARGSLYLAADDGEPLPALWREAGAAMHPDGPTRPRTERARSASLTLLYGMGHDPATLEAYRQLAITPDTLGGDVVLRGEPIVLARREALAERYPALRPLLETGVWCGSAAYPLFEGRDPGEHAATEDRGDAPRRVCGFLAFDFDCERDLDAGERRFLAALSELAGQALERARLAMAERAARDRALYVQQLTAALVAAATEADVAAAAVEYGGRAVGAHVGALSLLDVDDPAWCTLVAGPGVTPEVAATWHRHPAVGNGPGPLAMRTGEPQYDRTRAEYLEGRPELTETAARLGIEAHAALSLLVGRGDAAASGTAPADADHGADVASHGGDAPGRTVLGALVFCFPAAREFTAEDDTHLRTVADLCAQALERARLLAAEARARARAEADAARLRRLATLTAAVAAPLTRAEVTRRILEQAVETARATGAGVLTISPDGREFVLLDLAGYDAPIRDAYVRIPIDTPVPAREAWRTGRPLYFESREAYMAAGYRSPPADARGRIGGAWAALPLLLDSAAAGLALDRPEERHAGTGADDVSTRSTGAGSPPASGPIGVLVLSFDTPDHLAPAERDFLEAFAGQCAQALERARLFEAEQVARAEAERANRARAEFLANMSHELRTPLNAIGGYVQLVDLGVHGPVSDAQRGALARVQRAQQHLLGLINDVLNFAKLEAGRVDIDLRAVPMADVVRDVLPMIEPQIRTKGLELSVSLADESPDSPVHAWADRDKLVQVLLNLLTNACKFTPPRLSDGTPGRITVALAPHATKPEGVELSVRDTGIGIPDDKQAAIFEPFVQVSAGLTRTAEGAGLGLAISQELVRGMGGELRVRSAPGAGSTFTITLRRCRDHERVGPEGDAAGPNAARGASSSASDGTDTSAFTEKCASSS
jgi:PAS domain S-box-containing protein